ncbi:MAG: hypothetical protein HYR85_07235 [Planctomycetes bacterium]|nr:hypothetical protein [Planctomycetota bacterium]MBI3848522.1 hypothetical protein [Planctomycetota bacterium]
MSTKARILAGSVVAAVALTVSAFLFTSHSASAVSQQDALRARVGQFWDCRVKGDWVKEYELMSPDLHDQVKLSDYVATKGFISYYSYEVEKIDVNEDTGHARVRYTWRANHPAFSKASAQVHTMEDDWVLIDGAWFKKYVPPSVATPQVPSSPWEDSGATTSR